MNSNPGKETEYKGRSKRLEYNRNWILNKRKNHLVIQKTLNKHSIESSDEGSSESKSCSPDYSNFKECFQSKSVRRKVKFDSDLKKGNEDACSHNYKNLIRADINEWDIIDEMEEMIPISDLESDDDKIESRSIADELKAWAQQFEIKQNAFDSLLRILRSNGHKDVLPACARTLLKTPRLVELKNVSGMSYYHFGLKYMIEQNLKKISLEKNLDSVENLSLSINIDGLPLFKSSNTSAWPILCVIDNIKECKVFPISFTVGTSKPSNLNFLNDTVSDLIDVCQNGINFGERIFPVSITCIICDAPAKALIKNTKHFSGYYGCDRCDQHGEYFGRVTYQKVSNLSIRTNASFRIQLQEEHHKGNTPITHLPIDMIKQFPIDYMHQVCLGVTKRLLLTWMRGPRADFRLSAAQISEVSEKLILLKQFIPKEFARKPRSLVEIDRWKATEFRQFLLYTGQFALKGILPSRYYNHFMVLNVAISILVSKRLTSLHGDYAQSLLEYFVTTGRELYGREFLVYNVHSLVHLKGDACEFGSLENCAAWKFENFMQQLKRKVRCGNRPAVQLVKRVLEELFVDETNVKGSVSKQNSQQVKEPNNAFKSDVTGKFYEVLYPDSVETYMCRVYHTQEPQFLEPCDSRIIGATKFHCLNYEMIKIRKDTLSTRCMLIKQGRNVVFLPLLHEIQD